MYFVNMVIVSNFYGYYYNTAFITQPLGIIKRLSSSILNDIGQKSLLQVMQLLQIPLHPLVRKPR